MRLNNISSAEGAKHVKRRVGRGIGSGLGKTAGRGHKGQKSRSGGYHKVGFEGGQMPIQRRLPKHGFKSLQNKKQFAELGLSEIEKIDAPEITVEVLKKLNSISASVKKVKLLKTGALNKKVILKGISVTKGAKSSVEALGGNCVE